MQVLFIHGLGRSPLSGWSLLRQLRHAGFKPSTFANMASLDDSSTITARLALRNAKLAAHGDYILIGHSLGGVLLRAAVNALPPEIRQPRHAFLLGSPVRPARLAQRLHDKLLYRLATGDCGQLLSNEARMAGIAPLSVPTTAIIGICGLSLKRGPFGGEANDGVVAESEVGARWIADIVRVPVIHTLLPSSRLVAAVILQRLAQYRTPPD